MKKLSLFLSVLLITVGVGAHTQANATEILRSTTDRLDDFKGYQIHVVYVVPKGTADLKYDTNGFLDSMSKDAQRWLREKTNNQLKIDTYQGQLDVTFLQSRYSASELCKDGCDTLALLAEELQQQDSSIDGSKTIYFNFSEPLDENTCGWALNTSALALGHSSAGSCNRYSALTKAGITDVAETFIHEIFHTYGVDHVCGDNSELMIGSPECKIDTNLFGQIKVTLDTSRSNYFGGNKAGVDVLKLPVWETATINTSDSVLSPISGSKYLPKLKSGLVILRNGMKSESFEWEWNRNFSLELLKSTCLVKSELGVISGEVLKESCFFDIPPTWDVGMNFTVTQELTFGPFSGVASADGKIAREDFSVTPCTEDTCYVGGATSVDLCWNTDRSQVNIQKLIKGSWKNVSVVKVERNREKCDDPEFPKYTNVTVAINEVGNNFFRWYAPEDSKTKEFRGVPFAIIGHLKHQSEPTSSEIAEANKLARSVGAQVDKLGSQLIKTIRCVNQKNISKKVVGISPVCPAGFKLKK